MQTLKKVLLYKYYFNIMANVQILNFIQLITATMS